MRVQQTSYSVYPLSRLGRKATSRGSRSLMLRISKRTQNIGYTLFATREIRHSLMKWVKGWSKDVLSEKMILQMNHTICRINVLWVSCTAESSFSDNLIKNEDEEDSACQQHTQVSHPLLMFLEGTHAALYHTFFDTHNRIPNELCFRDGSKKGRSSKRS